MIVSKNNWFQRGLGMKALPLILIIALFAYSRGRARAIGQSCCLDSSTGRDLGSFRGAGE